MKKTIKLFDPVVGTREEQIIKNVLRSHFWASGAGTGFVAKFEREFSKFLDSASCVAVNSGTAALHLALSLFNIKNREVVIPSLSFVSTAHSIIYNGGRPIFADVDPKTLCIDPDEIRRNISKNTAAVMPVHFAGMPCNLDEIKQICQESKAVLVEDAAHAAGTTYNGRKIGTHGAAVCFSFHPVKNLAMPTGGAITLNGSNSDSLKKILYSRRWCGISDRKESIYDVSCLGWNYYMNEFSAAIGLEQLKKLKALNSIRRKIAKRFFTEIEVEYKMPYSDECSYHFYWILVKNRRQFMKKMKENGVETGIHYRPIHKMKFYCTRKKLPNTEYVGEKIVSIPIHPNLSNSDVNKIVQLINRFS